MGRLVSPVHANALTCLFIETLHREGICLVALPVTLCRNGVIDRLHEVSLDLLSETVKVRAVRLDHHIALNG